MLHAEELQNSGERTPWSSADPLLTLLLQCFSAAKIIDQTGLGQPAAFAVFIAVSNFVSTIIALRLIDRVGRRALLLRTLLGMIGGMALLSFAFLFIRIAPPPPPPTLGSLTGATPGASPWAFVAVFAMCGFCVSYALGLGNVAWVVQSEVSVHPHRIDLRLSPSSGTDTPLTLLSNATCLDRYLTKSCARSVTASPPPSTGLRT